jgi:hypothetical protein
MAFFDFKIRRSGAEHSCKRDLIYVQEDLSKEEANKIRNSLPLL